MQPNPCTHNFLPSSDSQLRIHLLASLGRAGARDVIMQNKQITCIKPQVLDRPTGVFHSLSRSSLLMRPQWWILEAILYNTVHKSFQQALGSLRCTECGTKFSKTHMILKKKKTPIASCYFATLYSTNLHMLHQSNCLGGDREKGSVRLIPFCGSIPEGLSPGRCALLPAGL